MTDVSSNYLAREHKMIETGKGDPGMRPRVVTTKSVITAPKADGDDRSVRSVRSLQNSLKNATTAPSVKIDDDEKGSTVDSYASLRIAGNPRVKISAANNDAGDAADEVRFGSEEEEEGDEYSEESAYEQENDDEEGDYESDGSFEDIDGGFSGYAKIKADAHEFSPYARISAPDTTTTDVEQRKYIDRGFSPYAVVSVPENDIDRDDGSYAKISAGDSEIERDAAYARVSAAGSEGDFNYGESNARVSVVGSEGKEMDRESFTGFKRVSKAGSDAEQNYLENFARVSVAGSDHGRSLARVSVAGSDHGREFGRESLARVSVAGSDHGRDFGRDSVARVSVAGSDHERDFGRESVARVSIAGSEYGRDLGRESITRVSIAGSEYARDFGRESVARVSVAGSEYGRDFGRDSVARVSVAGSEYGRDFGRESLVSAKISVAGSEYARETTARAGSGYARVSVAGSEYEHGKDAKRGGPPSRPRISVEESEAGYRKDPEQESPGYARISAVRSSMELGETRQNDYPSAYAKVSVMDGFVDLPSPNGSGFKIKKYENELYSESEKSDKNLAVNVVQDEEEDGDDDVYEAYLELSPEMRAKLEYQVRVVLVSPLFESSKKLSKFSTVYKKKFGRDVEQTGFGSAARLCRAMPHIVQRSRLEKDGELWLVDSAKNRRAVAGIRSGLRRIVYDVLKESSKISCEQLEEECSEALGKPLVEILTEHGYDTPTVECLVKDMTDLVICVKEGKKKAAILCADAEDPSQSDGLLLNRSVSSRTISYVPEKKVPTELERIQEAPAEVKPLPEVKQAEAVVEPQLDVKPGKLKRTPTRVTMRGLRREIRRHDFQPGPASTLEYEILQARIRLRVFLAFHNKGQGVEVSRLLELYETTFKGSLDLQLLGFGSVLELARSWNDIFLFHDCDPDWVFLAPLEANKRILNTLRTGLRSAVHSVLICAAPDGLQLSDFLHRLQEALHGKLWEVLQNSGYACLEPEKLERFMNSKYFQLQDFEEIRLLLDDVMDFVRLGSDDDGCLLVRLNDAGEKAPMLDLVDCKMEEADVGSFDELFVKLMLHALHDEEDDGADDGSENGSKQSEGEVVAGVPVPSGLVAQRIHDLELGIPLRATHSPSPASLRFKHEIRLILGSAEYIEKGVAWSDFNKIYQDRTGRELGSKAKVKKLLREIPDVVCKESLTERYARLFETPKNQRILAATRNGYRQVLWWASIFNSGGLWPNLLEGWFRDLDGRSFVACLQECGYEASKSRPLSPVSCFFRDMGDLLEKRSHSEVYTWAGGVEDPLHQDASLLGVSEIMIQFDPSRGGIQSLEERVAPASNHEHEGKAAEREDHHSSDEDHHSDSADSEEGSSNHTSEKEIVEAEKREVLGGKLEAHVEPRTEVNNHLNTMIEKLVVNDINAGPPTVEEPVITEDIPEDVPEDITEDIAEKIAVVEDKAHEQHLPDRSFPAPAGPIESAPVDNIPVVERRERIEEFPEVVAETADAEPAVYDNRFHSGKEYSGGADGNSENGDNEDKKVYVSGSRDAREAADDERVYVSGGTHEDDRREDERVYILGNSEGLKVRRDEDEDEDDEEEEDDEDAVANAYAQLRIAGKGPAINLDEWQFTDSEEEYDAGDDDEEDDDFGEDEDSD